MTAPEAAPGARPKATIAQVFIVFLIIGATSFGGGVVAYLRNSLVKQHGWLDDTEFVELMSISNTLPGLNATNMSILAGNRMCGAAGSIAAMLGMCLPGFLFMTVAGILYGMHGDRTLVTAALKGIAAAAVGLVAATWYQLGRKSVRGFFDMLIVIAAIIAINEFKLPVPVVLLGAGALAIFYHRPGADQDRETESKWISSLQ